MKKDQQHTGSPIILDKCIQYVGGRGRGICEEKGSGSWKAQILRLSKRCC